MFDRSGGGVGSRTMSRVTTFYHVTSAVNRDSILNHGLDWQRGSGGIAGSLAPEQPGVFLCRDRGEADFFVQMGKRRFVALDIWEVTLDDDRCGELLNSDQLGRGVDGFFCWMEAIPRSRLCLVERDL